MRSKHLLLTVLIAGCAAEPELGTYEGAVISDAVHANGTAGFYWLPPMVSAPSPTGVFEAAASPTLEIIRLDTNAVVRTLVPTVDVDKFQANWDTKADNLSTVVNYRVRARLPGGRIVGYADVDVVSTGAQVKGVDTAEFVALVDGRTLPIKFRIEHATVDADADSVLDWLDNCPTTPNANQADSLGNGTGDACRCASIVSCAAPDACHAAACTATAGCNVTELPNGTVCGTASICAAGACSADTDGDGVIDSADNCPSDANADQADSLSNGTGDACRCASLVSCTAPDACHTAACSAAAGCEVTQLADGTSCGTASICAAGACSADTDGDGVIDSADNCPSDANADQGDSLGNGNGDACRCALLTCSAPDACHSATCSATSGCGTTQLADGTSCGTGSSCQAGVCTSDRCDVVEFDAPYAVTTRSPSWQVKTADLNGDGRLDLLSADYGEVSVFLNNGSGFGPRALFSTDAYSTSLAIGDINNDGKLDVVANNYIVHKVSILLGTGTGTFQPFTSFATSSWGGGAGNVMTELGDTDGDGDLDLAIGYASGEFEIWTNNGTGTFTYSAIYNFAGGCCDRPVMARFGDLNHDGRQDIVVANQGTNVAVLMNAGGGTFTGPVRYATANYPTLVELTDLNGDGHLDIVAGTQVAHVVTTLLGTGTGSFGSRHDTAALGGTMYGLTIADFDRDGKPDVAATARSGQPATIYVGNGDGSLTVKTTVTVGAYHDFTSAVAGDFDGDGRGDVAVVDATTSKIWAFTNNGACTINRCNSLSFDPPVSIATGDAPQMVRTADMNSDGRLDLVSADYGAGASVYLNTGSGFTRTTYPTEAYPNYVSVGDVNNDGKLDVVISDYIVHKVSVLLGTGTGALQPFTWFATCTACGGGAGNVLTELGDANGDGKLDLVIGYTGGELEIWTGNGTGAFAFNAYYDLSGTFDRPVMARFGDLNHDGKQDIVVANQGTNVAVLMNAGSGAFTGPVRYATTNYPTLVELTDLNGDSHLDIVVGTQVEKKVTTLLGTGTGSFGSRHDTSALGDSVYGLAVADFDRDGNPDVGATAVSGQPATIYVGNGDGSLTVKTTLTVASTHYFTSSVAGDFDGDGNSDFAVIDYVTGPKIWMFTNSCP